jgi:hypothetical protein
MGSPARCGRLPRVAPLQDRRPHSLPLPHPSAQRRARGTFQGSCFKEARLSNISDDYWVDESLMLFHRRLVWFLSCPGKKQRHVMDRWVSLKSMTLSAPPSLMYMSSLCLTIVVHACVSLILGGGSVELTC